MMVKTYDRKSYELAEHFLQDEPNLNVENARVDLARTIQTAIEDWFEDCRRDLEPPTDQEREADERATYCPSTD